MLSFLAEKYNLVMDAKSVVKEIKAENNEEVISPSSSADDHESHEGGSLNTATSSPSSTPTENVLNGTLTASSSAPQNNHQQQKNNGVSFQQPGNEGQFPFGMQPNLAKLGFQMPIDFSNVFNLFEKVATPHFNPANLNPQFEGLFPNHHSLLPPGSSYASSIQQHPKKQIVDQQGALSQISQFLNTQQKATLTKSPSPIFLNENRKEGVQEMSNSRGIKRPLSNHNTSDSGPSEKKRSYPYTFQYCVLCQKDVHSSKLPCHIRQCHIGKPMFQCPACDFTSTYSKNNVKSHMVSLHGLAGDPISYMDQYADQVEGFMKKCFPNVRGRGRPVHDRHSSKSPQANNNNTSNSSITLRQLPVSGSNKHSLEHKRSPNTDRPTAAKHNNGIYQKKHAGNRRSSSELAHENQTVNNINNNNNGANELNGLSAMKPNLLKLPTNTEAQQERIPPTNIAPFNAHLFNPLFYLQQHLNGLSGITMPLINNERGNENEMLNNNNNNPVKMNAELNGKPYSSTSFAPQTSGTNGQGEATKTSKKNGIKMEELIHENGLKLSPAKLPLMRDVGGEEPRYLPQNLSWSVLGSSQIENTVFKTFTNSSELIEKLDLNLFEELSEKSNQLLTNAQLQRVSEVRRKINLKDFEIIFAIHRLDLDILKPAQVELVESIAPLDTDVMRFSSFEQMNSLTGLNDDERFIIQLSKLELLREKLALMRFMGSFDERILALNEQITELVNAARFIHNSSKFHTILHLILAYGNLIAGDFDIQLMQGYQASMISQMCAFKFSSGISLMEILADRIRKCFPELEEFPSECNKALRRASKLQFSTIVSELNDIERIQRLAGEMTELQKQNLTLQKFLAHSEVEGTQIRESLNMAKNQLVATMVFFGESIHNSEDEQGYQPEIFLRSIAQFAEELDEQFHK